MVEFGLKLQDNKVAEWGEHYVAYEKLKQIIGKAGAAYERYADLAAKKPEIAKMVTESYKEGVPTPKASKDNLFEIGGAEDSSERTTLTATASGGYGSGGGNHTIVKRDSSNSLFGLAVERATSGVADYFQRGYEKQVREALKSMEETSQEFNDALHTNLETVNKFYDGKLEELEERLHFLKESVMHSRAQETPAGKALHHELEALDEETSRGSGSQQKTLKRSNAKVLTDAIARMIGPTKKERRESTLTALMVEDESEQIVLTDADREKKVREAESIQRALIDQYRTVRLLHNFALMNYTGFVKIVKKHDKTLPEDKGRYKSLVKPEKVCNEGRGAEELSDTMEEIYAKWFCDGNVSEARAQIMPKKGDGLEMDWSQLRFGYRLGMCSILGLWVCWDCIWGLVKHGLTTIGARTAFPVFRGVGGLIFLQWCWGGSVWVWTRYRVNYIYLFDFNPHIVASPLAIFNEAVDNTLVFLVCMLLYYKSGVHEIPGKFPPGVFPLVLILYTVVQLIFPLRRRAPMWKAMFRVATAPMHSPSFFEGYVGDIFTSLVKVFQDLIWTFFFITTGEWMVAEDLDADSAHSWSQTMWYRKLLIPLVTLLPLWFRFNQCLRRYTDTGARFPHLANAFKYALSQTVTLFGAFHPLYMRSQRNSDLFQAFWSFIFVASSLYSFVWDVSMDWGLGRPKYNMLGPRLMYPKRWSYYAIICIDLVLRFAWVLTLVPPQSGARFALPQYLTAVSMCLEIFRRSIWGFLRLENEHRSNASGFRRTGFVPLHFTTGHGHTYDTPKEHRGFSVLVEVSVVTVVVLAAAAVSVVAAQHATERSMEL